METTLALLQMNAWIGISRRSALKVSRLSPAVTFLNRPARYSSLSQCFPIVISRRLLSSNRREPKPWDEPPEVLENRVILAGKGAWVLALVMVGAGAGLAYWAYDRRKEIEVSARQTSKNVGKPAIGGPIKLTDTKGNTITEHDFQGKWVLLYFGFTNCPDICPEELEKMSEVHVALQKAGYPSVPVFVSIDPERDTQENVREYLKEFHEDFVGLTGTVEEITKVVKTFRVFFNKGPADKDGDYIVDHSIIVYLMNPGWTFLDYYGQNKTASEITKSIRNHISTGGGLR